MFVIKIVVVAALLLIVGDIFTFYHAPAVAWMN